MDRPPLSKMIAQQRTRRGLQQQDLADVVGVSVRTIKAWEAGTNRPAGDNLRRVTHTLDIDLSDRSAELTDELIERALRAAPDTALVSEFSRRLARSQGSAERHDQSNVRPFGGAGMDFPAGGGADDADAGPA